MNEETIPALLCDDHGLCTPVELYRNAGGQLTLPTGDVLRDTGETVRVAGWYDIDQPTDQPVYTTADGLEVVVCMKTTTTMEATFDLIDDGTMDTVVAVTCPDCGATWELRYQVDPPDDGPAGDWPIGPDGGTDDAETEAEWDRVAVALDMAREDFAADGCPECEGAES
jgi:hypothetical protein